jgi:hypothetical protein
MNNNILEESNFIFFKNEKIINGKGRLGIDQNKILEIPKFVSKDTAQKLVNYFKTEDRWTKTAFAGSLGAPVEGNEAQLPDFGLSDVTFKEINFKLKQAIEVVFGKSVIPASIHAQKWEVGSLANPHSDNSDFEGNPSEGFEKLKYVGILYLNDDYDGGDLYFPEHGISIHPNAASMYIFSGGVENIHGVTEITNGTRYSIVSFWDFK